MLNRVNGLAHITGGGIAGNLSRTLPSGCGARIDTASWETPNLFRVLQDAGKVSSDEMFEVFNMGVGMIAIVPPAHADDVVASLRSAGEAAGVMGEIEGGQGVRYG